MKRKKLSEFIVDKTFLGLGPKYSPYRLQLSQVVKDSRFLSQQTKNMSETERCLLDLTRSYGLCFPAGITKDSKQSKQSTEYC